jgi:hypothetical protein
MELVPYEEGCVTIFHRSPSGELSAVYTRHKYRLWFEADLPGTHQLWYRAGYHDSNKISFRVYCLALRRVQLDITRKARLNRDEAEY